MIPLYTTWVGSDFIREGQDAGYWLEDYLKEQGRDEDEINIVVLQGTKGATATIGRTRGFNEVAKVQHNWNILEQVDGEFTTAKGKRRDGKASGDGMRILMWWFPRMMTFSEP